MKKYWKLKLEQSSGKLHFIVIFVILVALSLIKPLFWLALLLYSIYLFKNKFLGLNLKLIALAFSLALILAYYLPNRMENGSVKGIVVEKENNKIVLKSGFKSYLIYTTSDLAPGDYALVDIAEKEPVLPSYEGDFDYPLYLRSKGYYKAYSLNSAKIIRSYKTFSYFNYKAYKYYENKIDPSLFPLFSALVLGKNNLDLKTKNIMGSLNILHILALSGFHLSLLYSFFSFILFKLSNRKYLSENIALAIISAYALFCGLEISLLRALLFILINKYNKNNGAILTQLDVYSLSFLIVLFKPLRIFSLGFKLSFLSSFLILFLNDFIKTKNHFLKSFYSGLIILLGTFPLLATVNNSLSLFSLISFLLMDFYSYFFIPVSFVFLFIPGLSFYLGDLYLSFNSLLELLSKSFNFSFPYMKLYIRIIYYLGLTVILTRLSLKRFKALDSLFLVIPLIFFKFSYKIEQNYLEFINVGQGDTCYINTAGKNILIDAFNVIEFLDKRDIRKIDAIFITHSDNDHFKDLDLILSTRRVDIVYTNAFDNGIDEVCNKRVRLKKLKASDTVKLGQANIKVLSPEYDFYDKNANSLVLEIKMLRRSFLFMGDSTVETEKYLGSAGLLHKCDLLKVGHHGSITSTSDAFLEAVRPSYAIISLGKNNYGMPSDIVIKRLKKYSKVYITKDEGNIKFINDSLKPYRKLCYN